MSCIFCEIVAGNLDCRKVYEDENVLAFSDVNPKAPVHFLVIPKKHIENILKVSPNDMELVLKIFETIQKVAVELGLEKGFRIVNNCGVLGGQTVNHLHFHVLGKLEESEREDLTWPNC